MSFTPWKVSFIALAISTVSLQGILYKIYNVDVFRKSLKPFYVESATVKRLILFYIN